MNKPGVTHRVGRKLSDEELSLLLSIGAQDTKDFILLGRRYNDQGEVLNREGMEISSGVFDEPLTVHNVHRYLGTGEGWAGYLIVHNGECSDLPEEGTGL